MKLLMIIMAAASVFSCSQKNVKDTEVDLSNQQVMPILHEMRHGKPYTDEFHWLRDPNYPAITDHLILNYLEKEEKQTTKYFNDKGTLFDTIFKEIKSRLPKGKVAYTWYENGYKFRSQYSNNKEHRIWSIIDKTDGTSKVIIDENEQADKQTSYALLQFKLSPDGTLVSWVENASGTNSLHIKSIKSGNEIVSPIPNVKDDVVWASDSDSIFYVELDKKGREYKVVKTSITDPQIITTVYEEYDPERFVSIDKSLSTKYLIINSGTWTSSEVLILDLSRPFVEPSLVFSRDNQSTFFLNHVNDMFIVETDITDDNSDVLTFTSAPFRIATAKTVVDSPPETSIKETLVFATFIATHERKNGLDQLRITQLDTGKQHNINFPDNAYGLRVSGLKQSYNSQLLRIRYESLLTPRTIYDYDIKSKKLTTLDPFEIPNFDKENYVAEIIRVPSVDAVLVPVSIIYHKDTPPSKNQPLYLYTYGTYGAGIPPEFPVIALSLIDRGFTFAIAHVRGGDELGKNWHEQGRLMNRKNSFQDYLAVAEYLIEQGMVEGGNIFASAESSGGTIVAVAINEKPDIFKKIALLVPFVDVLNTLIDDSLVYTISDWDEFGNPKNDLKAYDYILSYSPYDNIKKQNYPSIYATAALDDPAVGYWEVAKWLSKINKYKSNESQLILDIRLGGHIESGRYSVYEEFAKSMVFFLD